MGLQVLHHRCLGLLSGGNRSDRLPHCSEAPEESGRGRSLRQKTEELDQFFNVSLDLLCIANTDGYFLRLNPAWERILGYTREELMAKRFLEFVHPDDLDRTRKAISTLASQQKVFSFRKPLPLQRRHVSMAAMEFSPRWKPDLCGRTGHHRTQAGGRGPKEK